MAGKSSRGRNKKASQTVANAAAAAVVPANGHLKDDLNPVVEQKVDVNGDTPSAEVQPAQPEVKESDNASSENQVKQGEASIAFVIFYYVVMC